MDLHSVSLAYYSPTRTTQRVLAAIAEGVGARTLTDVDLTLPDAKTRSVRQSQDDLVLFGAPVYAGRVAATATGRLRRVRGWGTPAVLVVVYGNRAFEDALLELADLAQSTGFLPVAAAAFIGEHSYATDAIPIALGRPDAKDLARATAFGQTIGSKLRGLGSHESLPPLAVPGHRPYRVGHQQSDVAPTTLADLCTRCGICTDVCPVGAITVGDTVVTDRRACTLCCACVKDCPNGARVMEDEGILRTARWLAADYGVRKEPEIFLA